MLNTILAILFGLVAVCSILFMIGYFLRKSAAAVTDKVSEKLSGSGLTLSVSKSSAGSRLVVSVSPIDAFDNEPEFPDEPMGGGEIPFELLDNFFSGTLPEPQMEYIETKLRDKGIELTRKVEKSEAVVTIAGDSSVKAQQPEPSQESVGAGSSQVSSVSEEVQSGQPAAGGGAPADDLPFSMEGTKEVVADGSGVTGEGPVEKEEGTGGGSSDGVESGVTSAPEVVVLPEDIDSPFDAADAVDNEPEFEITSGNDIPIEVMDYLVSPGDDQGKVDRYYCACRLGIAMDFHFLPENKERNVARLRAIREQCDKLSVSEVVSTFITCPGLFGGDSGKYTPKFEETVVGGPSFARNPVES